MHNIIGMTLERINEILGVNKDSNYNVVLYIFPHNATLTLQPLDNGVFLQHKKMMRRLRTNIAQAAACSMICLSPNSLFEMETVDVQEVTTALERTQGLCTCKIQFDFRSYFIMSEIAWSKIKSETILASFEVTGKDYVL